VNANRMMRVLFASALLLLVAVPAASAAKRDQIIRDCADGSLDGKYSASEMRDARNNLPADVDEYTDCRDLLTRATHSGGPAGSSGGAGGGSGTTGGSAGGAPERLSPKSPEDYKTLRDAIEKAGSEPVEFNGRKVLPGAAGFAADAARRGIPTPLLILLALLGVAAVLGAVPAIRKRVLGRHQT
jgi:heme A synthase